MKKKISPITEELKYVTVFRDDIEEVYNFFRSISENIEFEIDDYIPDGIEEIDKINNKSDTAEEMIIKSRNPYVEMRIDKNGLKFYTDGKDSRSQGYIYGLMKIFDNRENKLLNFFYDKAPNYSLVTLILGIVLLTFGKTNITLGWIGAILVGLSLLMILLALYVIVKISKSKILLSYRKVNPPFLKKHGRQIIYDLLKILLGVIAGYAFKQYFP